MLNTTTHGTAGSENVAVEITAESTTSEEPQTEPQPEPDTDLTEAAPPSYTETISYATVHDTDTGLPPSYSESVLPVPELGNSPDNHTNVPCH